MSSGLGCGSVLATGCIGCAEHVLSSWFIPEVSSLPPAMALLGFPKGLPYGGVCCFRDDLLGYAMVEINDLNSYWKSKVGVLEIVFHSCESMCLSQLLIQSSCDISIRLASFWLCLALGCCSVICYVNPLLSRIQVVGNWSKWCMARIKLFSTWPWERCQVEVFDVWIRG